MPDLTSDQIKNITQDLYSKNVDLVNANKILELIQSLYEIMVTSYSTYGIAIRFITTIVEKMNFSDGVVVMKDPNSEFLKIAGLTQSEINKTILDVSGLATVNFQFDLKDENNLLVKAFNQKKNFSSNKIYDIWTPYLKYGDNSSLENQYSLVYPITYGDSVYGSFALYTANRTSLTDFEKKAFDRIVNVFGVAVDRVMINDELEKTRKRELVRAREIIRLKDEFVFVATHDLRTPVTAIKGFADLLSREVDNLSDDAKDDFNAIYESAERLDKLVEDLLEVARSESGTIYIETKPVKISDIINQTLNEIKIEAEKKSIKIESVLENDETLVLGDKDKLHEVFENLVSNSIKYGKQNGSLRISSRSLDGFLEFEISDDGIGIPQDVQEKIFSKFFRARQKGTEEVPGTGLGLFVVRMLIEKMKGSISFTSVEGQGTTFNLKLPLAN